MYRVAVAAAMRKAPIDGCNAIGKVVERKHLPTKVCVVCNRPFNWRKKWERVWDDVTTCSKSCNATRKAHVRLANKEAMREGTHNHDCMTRSSGGNDGGLGERTMPGEGMIMNERDMHKAMVKRQKEARRRARAGLDSEDARKMCYVCNQMHDMLIRCTVDASRTYRMVCEACWSGVSGGQVDGNPYTHPHYTYGGVWKNTRAGFASAR